MVVLKCLILLGKDSKVVTVKVNLETSKVVLEMFIGNSKNKASLRKSQMEPYLLDELLEQIFDPFSRKSM